MTYSIWQVAGGVNILSKFQLPSSYGFGQTASWRFWTKGSPNKRMIELMNQKAVCRTAPATPGMLNTHPLWPRVIVKFPKYVWFTVGFFFLCIYIIILILIYWILSGKNQYHIYFRPLYLNLKHTYPFL